MSLSVIPCPADQVARVQGFFARVYGPRYVLATNDALFRWQFGKDRKTPTDPYNLKIVLLADRVIGSIGFTPVEVTCMGEVRRGAWLANWMVEPEQRRLGVGPLLVREIMRDFDVVLNLGPTAEARDLLGRMGWTPAMEVPRSIAVLDEAAAACLTESGGLDWPQGTLRAVGGTEVCPAQRFDPAAGVLWDRLGCDRVGTRRSAEYLNWRYADHPVFRHRILQLRSGDRLRGFVVYRVEEVRDMPVRVARLLELVAEAEVQEDLLRATLADALGQGAALMDFFCPDPGVQASLRQVGFLPSCDPRASQIPLLFQPLDRQRSAIYFMAYMQKVKPGKVVPDWYVTKSDADQDRPN